MGWGYYLLTPEGVLSGTIIAGLVSYFLRRLVLSFTKSDVATTEAKAEITVIEMLCAEAERFSRINRELTIALNDLQKENIQLKREISNLHTTISLVNEQVRQLTVQIRNLGRE